MITRIAIDIGGTFTDVALLDSNGTVDTFKVSTSSGAPAEAVLEALSKAGATADLSEWTVMLHGTTIGTNALLEHKLPKVALVTTAGFRDVLRMRRIERNGVFDLNWDPPRPLVPRQHVFEIDERMASDGTVLRALDEVEIERVVKQIVDEGFTTVAICLLHSYVNPLHEQALARALRAVPNLYVTVSSDVSPEMGEYERTSTVVAHAALRPVLGQYVETLESNVARSKAGRRLFVMQSSGGLEHAAQIVAEPARAVESGPAAGALFAARLARMANLDEAIAFDMGGTTAQACLLEHRRPPGT